MKNTLFVTLDFPPNIGGVSAYYKNICNHLNSKNLFVLTQVNNFSSEFDKQQSYSIFRKKLLSKNPFVWPKWITAITATLRIVKEKNIEHILAGNILPLGSVSLYIFKKKKISYSVFTHGMDITMLSGRKKILAKKILLNAHLVFVNSNYLRKQIRKFNVDNTKIITVYPCPNIKSVIKKESVEKGGEKKINLLTVGRLVKRKGHINVLDALSQIDRNLWHWTIAGDGKENSILKLLAKEKKISDNITFVSKPSNQKLANLYGQSDIFIMTPYQTDQNDVEGFGIVYLEAASFGIPAVATKTGGVEEAVVDGQTGIVVEPNNLDQIKNAIEKLISDSTLRKQLGQNAKERVENEFQWKVQVKKIIKKL